MRLLLTLLVLSSLCMAACTKPQSKAAALVLTPASIEVRGYLRLTRRTAVEFQIDGLPLEKTEAQLSVVQAKNNPVFEAIFEPLSNGLIISYSPTSETESDATLQLTYRGHEYTVPIHGVPEKAPSCEQSWNECVLIRFNPDADQCEELPLSNRSCEQVDCAHPGVCNSGVCVHREIDHIARSCSSGAEWQSLTPTWAYASPPGSSPIGSITIDEDGNSYFFEYPSGDLLSLDADGKLRWRRPALKASTPADAREVKTSHQHVFALDNLANRVWAFNRSDGAPLWEKTFGKPFRMLQVNDELWTLVDIQNPDGSELHVLDATTGEPRSAPAPLPVVDGLPFVYNDFLADDEGQVWLVGTNAATDPATIALAAIDATTREVVWTTSLMSLTKGLVRVAAHSGSLLQFSNGAAFDLKTRTFFPNEGWQLIAARFDGRLMTLNADGTALWAKVGTGACATVTLTQVDVRTEASAWNCFLGSMATLGGNFQRTPSGSAVVTSIDLFGEGDDLRPARLQVIDGSGVVQFNGILSGGLIGNIAWPVEAIHGQRLLLIRQVEDEVSGRKRIVAYDIPELLTK